MRRLQLQTLRRYSRVRSISKEDTRGLCPSVRSVKRADPAQIGFHPLNDPATCPAEGDGSLHTAEVSSCPECGSSRVRRITCSAIGEVANFSSCVVLSGDGFFEGPPIADSPGKRSPSLATIVKLARALDVSVADFFAPQRKSRTNRVNRSRSRSTRRVLGVAMRGDGARAHDLANYRLRRRTKKTDERLRMANRWGLLSDVLRSRPPM
jgi:hypothetical protein